MKLNIKHIVILLLAAVILMACDRNGLTTNGYPILMAPLEAGETKAMLDAETFGANGNQIRIYDYYTPKGAQTHNMPPYIPGTLIESNGNGSWPFEQGKKYDWTPDGTHKFFGWLEKDASLGNTMPFKPTFDQNTQILTISDAVVVPGSESEFDFMYSDVHWRCLDTAAYFTAVPLAFQHLLTSFSLAAYEVALYNDYIIDYVTFTGISTKNTVTIDYSGDQPVANYRTATGEESYTLNPKADGIQLTADLKDLMTGITLPSDDHRKYSLAWPQPARTTKLTIGYRVKDVSDPDANNEYISYTKTITIPYAWEAGKKNNLNLEFKDKEISLTYEIEPWNKITEEIDFSDQVTVESPITWLKSTIDTVYYSTGEVILFDDMNKEASAVFTILTPKGATWTASLISKKGHPDAFEFVDGTKYGVVGRPDTLKLKVTNLDPISPRHECELMITVQTADGRTIVVDDILTPEADENGNPTDYDRFTIIQNLIN